MKHVDILLGVCKYALCLNSMKSSLGSEICGVTDRCGSHIW